MISMDANKIKSLISLKSDDWENTVKTNCYVFALGLDVPENQICLSAYQVGVIGCEIFGWDKKTLYKLDYEQRFQLDLNALKIGFTQIVEDKTAGVYINGNYNCTFWDVLLFSYGLGDIDFHFARRNDEGKLWHKSGYFASPKECTEEEIVRNGDKLVKKYRLRYWEIKDLLF